MDTNDKRITAKSKRLGKLCSFRGFRAITTWSILFQFYGIARFTSLWLMAYFKPIEN